MIRLKKMLKDWLTLVVGAALLGILLFICTLIALLAVGGAWHTYQLIMS